MWEWILKYWLEVVFGALITGLGIAYKVLAGKVKKARDENAAIRDGLRSLLRRQIIEDCESSLKQGFCPITKKDTINDMYLSYHALGGNGTVTKLVDQIGNLPTLEGGAS